MRGLPVVCFLFFLSSRGTLNMAPRKKVFRGTLVQFEKPCLKSINNGQNIILIDDKSSKMILNHSKR
jgi:hypothetical protein